MPPTPSPAQVSPWLRLDALLTWLRPHRQPLSLAIDAAVIVVCWNFTYLFRLGFERWWSARAGYDTAVLVGVVALYVAVFVLLGVPRGMWRFSGFGEVRRVTIACTLAGSVAASLVLLAQLEKIPRSVLVLHPVITVFGLASVRLGYRMLYEHMRLQIQGGDGAPPRRALVLGAGTAARLLLAGIQGQGWRVVGLLDDDPAKQGSRLAGVPVLGPLALLPGVVGRVQATHVIVAMPAASGAQRKRALDLAATTGLPVQTVPSAAELHEGAARVERLRDIEPEDLLGREPVVLDEAGVGAALQGKVVLVTGGGGSIGSELCRQMARFAPAKLVVLELSEFNLYTIEQELREHFPDVPLAPLVGDVKDLAQMRRICARHRPQVVFHAAAYKHVPLMEEDDNAWLCLQNNTVGTWHAATAAAEQGAERFVLISTDKAVNPTNVMGATKRASEMVVSAMAQQHPGTRFMAVRFGNVLGSSGSVIPKFKEQIARGGPVTVTHPDIIRYFMTIPEASRLVLQAAAIGESGQVLVLDMGEPVRIVDLARDLIRLAGHAPEEIGLAFSGLRPGEKLYEELLARDDTTVATPVPRLRVAWLKESAAAAQVLDAVAACPALMEGAQARRVLRQLVPEFRPAAATSGR